MSSSFNSSCPNCDFLGNQPAASKESSVGTFLCVECGTKWREIEDIVETDAIAYHPSSIDLSNRVSSEKRIVIILAALVFVAGLYLSKGWENRSVDGNVTTIESFDQLSLAGISIESFNNFDGNILVVSGEVRNNSSFRRRVPPLVMHWGHKGSSGYFDWIYHPALQNLAPGARFRFRTAIRKPKGGTGPLKLEFGGA